MVTTRFVRPRIEAFNRIDALNGPLRIFSSAMQGANEMFLSDSLNCSVRLYCDWNDVEFKFELLSLEADLAEPVRMDDEVVVANIQQWQQFLGVFRFEWDRPVDECGGQVRERGLWKNVPSNVIAVGCSMIGLVLLDSNDSDRRMMFLVDEEVPGTIRLIEDCSVSNQLLENCELVPIRAIHSWNNRVIAWMSSR